MPMAMKVIDRVGGLSGGTDTGSIANSYATGAVYGNEGNDRVGGIAGSDWLWLTQKQLRDWGC